MKIIGKKRTPEEILASMERSIDTATDAAYAIATEIEAGEWREDGLSEAQKAFHRNHVFLVEAFRALVRKQIYEKKKQTARGLEAEKFLLAESYLRECFS